MTIIEWLICITGIIGIIWMLIAPNVAAVIISSIIMYLIIIISVIVFLYYICFIIWPKLFPKIKAFVWKIIKNIKTKKGSK